MESTPLYTPEQCNVVDFCEKIKNDTKLQEELKSAGSHEEYIKKAIAIGKKLGHEFKAEDLYNHRGQRVSMGELGHSELEEASGSVTCDFWLSPTCA